MATPPSLLTTLGEFRWVRVHISMFWVGVVILVTANLLFRGADLWSLTVSGIWLMLLVVHLIIVAIARLSAILMAEDDEGIVMLPVNEALIVERSAAPATPDDDAAKGDQPESEPTVKDATKTVSWKIATDAAQVKRTPAGDANE